MTNDGHIFTEEIGSLPLEGSRLLNLGDCPKTADGDTLIEESGVEQLPSECKRPLNFDD